MARQVEQVRDHLRKFPAQRGGSLHELQVSLLRQGHTVTLAAIYEVVKKHAE